MLFGQPVGVSFVELADDRAVLGGNDRRHREVRVAQLYGLLLFAYGGRSAECGPVGRTASKLGTGRRAPIRSASR